MPTKDTNRMSTRDCISLDALIDEAASKYGPDAVNNVLKTCGVTQVEDIEQDDYWSVVSELQLLCSDM